MPRKPAPKGYSALQIWLHWLIAAFVIFQLFVHDEMSDAFDDRLDGDRIEGDEFAWATLHIAVGLTVLVLAIVRLFTRLARGAPKPHHDKPAVLIWAATATHWLLYGFIFFMPLSGALAWFGKAKFSAEAHEFGQSVLVPLVLLHAAGALAEHFVFRNDSLRRMLSAQRG